MTQQMDRASIHPLRRRGSIHLYPGTGRNWKIKYVDVYGVTHEKHRHSLDASLLEVMTIGSILRQDIDLTPSLEGIFPPMHLTMGERLRLESIEASTPECKPTLLRNVARLLEAWTHALNGAKPPEVPGHCEVRNAVV